MEPLDPAKNDESSGFSKRRISSILKAPRKSTRFPAPEQQENVVESTKPVEKRNSRRVSFAPANDVLLFSKDLENASSARSPFQELITTAAPAQNRVQVEVPEDGIQQIMGMETLLNAPLHASQQKDKGAHLHQVNFDTGLDFGERTVMFSTDDAFMDMTHSHTINIADGAELLADIPLQNYEVLHTSREKTVLFTADDASMDMTLSHSLNMTNRSVSLPASRSVDLSLDKREISSSAPCVDPGFKNFLSNLIKPSGPSVSPVDAKMAPAAGKSSEETGSWPLAPVKRHRADADKENKAPASVSAMMEKSLNTSRKNCEESYGSAFCPKDDLSMDMTEALTGHIKGFTDDDDDPLQCLFPTQEMYESKIHHDKKVSHASEKTKEQQRHKMLTFNPKDMTSQKNLSLHASHQGRRVNLDAKDGCSEKTIMFTAGDEFMDMTQSHTVNIAGGSLALPNQNCSSANGLDPGFQTFCSSLSKTSASSGTPPKAASSIGPANTNSCLSQQKNNVDKENQSLNTTRGLEESFHGGSICPDNDVCMDMTETQTGRIEGLTGSDDPFQFLLPTQDSAPHCGGLRGAETRETSGQKNSEALGSYNSAAMETSLKPSLMTTVQRHQVKFNVEDDCREQTVRFTAEDAFIDVTRSHTANIISDLKLQSGQNEDLLPSCGEKTVKFTANDAAMDWTGCHTVNIVTNLNLQAHQNVDSTPSCREQTVRFTAEDAFMDVTQSHTANIISDLRLQSRQNEDFLPACGDKTKRFTANDAAMDMTGSHTANIATNFNLQPRQNEDFLPACGDKTKRFTANDAAMDMTGSHTANIATNFNLQSHQNVDSTPSCREQTVRFTAEDAFMDVTQSHTANIISDLKLQSSQNEDFLPARGDKTKRFTANDAAMDMTGSHTANIATNFNLQPRLNVDSTLSCREQTERFTGSDATMDVTRSHTANIVSDLKLQSRQNVGFLPSCGEKTVKFTANDAAMDMTGSHTANIATNFNLQSQQNVDLTPSCREQMERVTANDATMDITGSHTANGVSDLKLQSLQNDDFLPAGEDKMKMFTANDAAMDMTGSHTANIVSSSVSGSVLPYQDSNVSSTYENMGFPLSARKRENETHCPQRNQPSSSHTLDTGFNTSLSKRSGPCANSVTTKAVVPTAVFLQETVNTDGLLNLPKKQKPDVSSDEEVPEFVPNAIENPVRETTTDCPENIVNMDVTEAQTGHILERPSNEPPQCLSSTQDMYPNSDHWNPTDVPCQQTNTELELSNPDAVEITNHPDSLESNETDNLKKPKPRNQTYSPSAVDYDINAAYSQKSRRKSLADLHSKLRRLSHMINTVPDTVEAESCTAPLPQLEHAMDKNSGDKTKSLPAPEHEPETAVVKTEKNTQAQFFMEEEQPSTPTTPLNSKTQLMSRLSVGGFKPKLPRRSKADDPKKVNSVGEHTRTITVNVTHQLSDFDDDVSDINDEELGSCEDTTEIVDTRSSQIATEKTSPSQEFYMEGPLEDCLVDEVFISDVHGKKRPLPGDESNMEDEKRMKASAETATDFEMGFQSSPVECDSNVITAPCTATQIIYDSNSSCTASIRCKDTFESTLKQSLFESQLEDYANDMQKKFDDGTITVLEFFKLFNIDFVIHNPRQSVLSARLLTDIDRTPMDLLKDRHINCPKQMVYEANVLSLTEKVEGLKERKQDLEKPLVIVNRTLWEEMRNSSEEELKSFGAKLKERNNLFRKMSKVQSHEMKEVLYSDLVKANLEEQQKLRGTIEKADEMIKSLDDCILEIETEIAAVVEKGFTDTSSLKSHQEEMQKVTEAFADSERQISELEMQKKQNLNKLNRLKAETRNLESHITALHTVNEWKLGEKKDNSEVYTFLYETLLLQLVYERCEGKDADKQSEKKISHITFKQQLNEEKSQGHASLVHKLLSQYIEGEAAWTEKYPTSRHVPQLLHDVSLVVSRCHLLGEELRRLEMWGALKLDILSISCVDTQVHIVFSSLKKFSKFEVIFAVSLTNHLCVIQVHSFKNMIGSTTIEQIEEIVASFSPTKNLLTKIVKKIHKNLLC